MTGCGRKLGPYDCCTVVCGDCLELMKALPDGCVDAVITDPPYGVGLEYQNGKTDSRCEWRDCMVRLVPEARRIARFTILPSCRILEMPWIYAHIPPDWLICWFKGSPGTSASIGFNDWEPHLAYGRPQTAMHDYFYAAPKPFDNDHPCPKPLAWGTWLVSRAVPVGGSVVDFFLGSGTTAVAAKKLGRHFLGFEISETYCQIARERIALVEMQPSLFQPQPEQAKIFT